MARRLTGRERFGGAPRGWAPPLASSRENVETTLKPPAIRQDSGDLGVSVLGRPDGSPLYQSCHQIRAGPGSFPALNLPDQR